MPEVRAFGAGAERPRILAVGCGGAGCNTIRAMPVQPGLGLLAVNDLPHPSMAGIPRRVLVDGAVLRAVAAMDEHAVKDLVTAAEKALAAEIADADLVVPFAGLGGETGSWGASLCARVAALGGATALAFVTTPFSMEGPGRRAMAAEALRLLRTHAHGVVTLPNDPLLRVAPRLPIGRALEFMAALAVRPLQDMARVLTREDVPLLKAALRGASEWQLGIGEGGKERPELAAVDAAFSSPWVSRPPEEAKQALLLLSMEEPNERSCQKVLGDVRARAPRASVMWGASAEPGTELRATVLLGF